MKALLLPLLCWLGLSPFTFAEGLPRRCQQALVGTSPGWDSSQVTLQLFEKSRGRWQAVSPPWKGRLGKKGLAWGLGVHRNPPRARLKREGDGRAPAGIFAIGEVWGYARQEAVHPAQSYHQITRRDLWVEDPGSKFYNQHIRLDRDPTTPWEKKAQMRQQDAAHSLKLYIGHNSPPRARPGFGSAIFFHIWRRAGAAPTAGCTTMPEARLRELIRRINPRKKPHYILLPQAEYQARRQSWRLP